MTVVTVAAFTLTACESSIGGTKVSTQESVVSSEKTEEVKIGKKVYFAGPMFNQAKKEFNLRMTKVLEDHGYEVFLPQRDGIEGALLDGKSEEEMIEMIFPLNVQNGFICKSPYLTEDWGRGEPVLVDKFIFKVEKPR